MKRQRQEHVGSSMEGEKDAFYVVRKGDVIGVYKNLSDCQAQAGFSVCNPSVTVFKGFGLPRESEEYLAANGLKNALYTISARDVKEELFGKLVPCPFQQPSFSGDKVPYEPAPPTRMKVEAVGSTSHIMSSQIKHSKLDNSVPAPATSTNCLSCILLFDGASKGNPGRAGAGAVLRAEDGSVVYRIREGVGIATNNAAEYRAVILGLKYALKKGFKHIRVQGDSNLVCMQIQGLWKVNQTLAGLCKEAKELKDKFLSFQINHIMREFNSEADAQANRAIVLKDGQVEEDCIWK